MTSLPFQTYTDAIEYFGVQIPKLFFNNLITVETYCNRNGYHPLDILDNLFGFEIIEANEARYQQTPIELYPFGKTGVAGTHFGFVIHTQDNEDYPSGELCPMDSDGVILIGNTSHALFQNLLTDPILIDKHSQLLKALELEPIISKEKRYDVNGNGLKITVQPKNGWRFVNTSDGVGVFAEEKYFDTSHELFINDTNRTKRVDFFEELAEEMRSKGFYGSQLFYLKELYWNEWTNYDLAKKYLNQMLLPYEQLGRQHLYTTAKDILDSFDIRYPEWK